MLNMEEMSSVSNQGHVKYLAKVPRYGFLAHRFKMARSEPLIQEADIHITKFAIEAWMLLFLLGTLQFRNLQ